VEIAVEVQGQEPLEFLPHTEVIEEEPHPKFPTTMLNTFWSFKRNYVEHGLE
jgi:hypothetical protein